MRIRPVISFAVCLLASAVVGAQGPASQPAVAAAFDVVSVKPDTQAGGPTMLRVQAGGRYTATNVTVNMLILNAYRLQGFQLVGAPGWVSTDHYDIAAKSPADIAPPNPNSNEPTDLQLMLRAMLADRFKLKVHTETREVPTYDLVLARSDGRLGTKLTRSTTDCVAEAAAARAANNGAPPAFPAFNQPMKCGIRVGMGTYTAGSVTMAQIASNIAGQTGRTVTDRTGLTGNWDVDLSYTPDRMPARAPGTPADQPITVNGQPIDPNGPSIFTAIQEQLGLKLESGKGSVDVVVIDSIERPTED